MITPKIICNRSYDTKFFESLLFLSKHIEGSADDEYSGDYGDDGDYCVDCDNVSSEDDVDTDGESSGDDEETDGESSGDNDDSSEVSAKESAGKFWIDFYLFLIQAIYRFTLFP